MIAARIAVLCLIPPTWLAAASWIYCLLKGSAYPYVFPFDQWIVDAPWWRYDPWTTVCVAAGAAVPTLVAALICIALFQIRRRNGRALYGKSDWADPGERKSGGIGQSRSLF